MSMRPSITRFRDPDTGKLVGQEDDATSGVWVSKITRFGSMFANGNQEHNAAPPPPADTSDAEALKLEIKRCKAAGDDAALQAIALAEYARPDGGRPTVKGMLSFNGVKKPAATAN